MPCVIDGNGAIVYKGESDAQCVRWWRLEGEPEDRLADTGELMSELDDLLRLEH